MLATFDPGSYRSAISEKFLMMLEEKGSRAITSRQACTPTDVSGVVGSVATQYHEVVGLTITFRESETREGTIKLLCVALPDPSSSSAVRLWTRWGTHQAGEACASWIGPGCCFAPHTDKEARGV